MPTSRIQFEKELGRVNAELLSMATKVGEDLEKAVQALRDRNPDLAALVKAGDAAVNSMQLRVQDMAAVLIATQQPVARDMRRLIAAIRLSDNLERMGDYVVHLAKTAIKLKDSAWPRQFGMLAEMGKIGYSMVSAMMEAYLKADVEAAARCAAMDSGIDELHKAIFALTLKDLQEKPGNAEEAVKLLRTSVFLERLGDHVTNSCELVSYIVSGDHTELNG